MIKRLCDSCGNLMCAECTKHIGAVEAWHEKHPYSCYTCKYYDHGTWGGYYSPPEFAECTNDLAYRSMFLPTWPFVNGCKYHSKRI